MLESSEALIKSITMLFLIVDPLGNAPIFYAVTARMRRARRRRVIVESVAAATIILLAFSLVGDAILAYFGLRVADFRVAGGIILLLYGVAGVMGFTEAGKLEVEDESTIAIVPLATPLLAGPGAIATVLYIKAVYGLQYAIISTLVVASLTLIILLLGGQLLRLLGRSGAVALARIISFLLAAIAVAMIREGLEEYLAARRIG